MAEHDPGFGGDALELFAAWLSRREQGDAVEFSEMLRAHSDLRSELVSLESASKRLSSAGNPPSSSLRERIEGLYGKDSLSEVTLRERNGDTGESDLSSALISQLSSHSSRYGRYTIRGEVARGGMGAILKIWDEELRRHLAMKVILGQADAPKSGETPPIESSRVARFLEEAQVTGQLDHPGIVPVHELGLDPEGRLYFTMKLVKGESLHAIFEHVREGRDDWSQTRALNVLLKVCEAMAYAHDKGVIHRDLKPANVMVGKFGEVHVMDWGLARIEGQKDRKDIRIREDLPRTTEMRSVRSDKRGESPDSPLCTMDGDVVGTAAYMPPEQAAGKVDEVGPHSDVYALGAMLYHLLAGHAPYIPRGVRLNNYAVWARVQEGPPAPLAQLAPQTPSELLAICDKAMARDRKQRYRDMSEMAGDLSAYLNQRVVRAYETGTWAETRKWVQRNTPLAASLAAALLLLIAGLAASLIFKTQADEKAVLATLRQKEVLKLSAYYTLDELNDRAAGLWPARPALLGAYRQWMQEAEQLLAELPDLRASLARLEQSALPQSAEEREQERAANPHTQELEGKRPISQWKSRMVGRLPWPSVAETEAELAQETLPTDATALQQLAFVLANPDAAVLGAEVRALLLAQRAFAAASAARRNGIRVTLALAHARLGHFEEALLEARQARDGAGALQKQQFEGFVAALEAEAKSWRAADGTILEARVQEAEQLADEVARLQVDVERRGKWRFPEGSADDQSDIQWWHGMLQQLVADLERFGDPQAGLLRGVSQEHGPGIARRLELASTIEERSLSGPEARQRWSEAIESISASEKYAGVRWPAGDRLKPQLGLLPLGADPESGLWEFAELSTGEPAARGAGGALVVGEETGIVLVLIPGGTAWLGAQAEHPDAPNFDPRALANEGPVHQVELSPYFLSMYEMTQGQWLRVTGGNPSMYGPSTPPLGARVDLRHPVEHVTWNECRLVLERLGLELPSEAQWEYGARAGTDTPWWTGRERESLRGKVNLADQSAKKVGAPWESIADWPDLDDGWPCHAPVGSLPANPYGLHEVVGNVYEWSADGHGLYSAAKQRDPVVPWKDARKRVNHGGSYGNTAWRARSANREDPSPDAPYQDVGLRPARKLDR